MLLTLASGTSWGKKYRPASQQGKQSEQSFYVERYDWQRAKEKSKAKEAKVALVVGLIGIAMLFFVCPYNVVKAIKENRKLRAYEFDHMNSYGTLQFTNFMEAEAHRRKKDALSIQFWVFSLLTIPAFAAMCIGFMIAGKALDHGYLF